MKRRARFYFLGFVAATVGAIGAFSAAPAPAPPTTQQVQFFETKIRPVLVEHCYKCHSAQSGKNKGSLELDTRAGMLAGGDGGPIIVPGNPKDSRLIEAISYEDDEFQMPPKKSGGKLSDSAIADFTEWVKMGAPDPRVTASAESKKPYDTSAAKSWWSYQPLHDEPVPSVTADSWVHNDIDRFILAQQEDLEIKPVADADKVTLLRRVYFDLTGLPPPPEEMKKFLAAPASSTAKAYEAIVDKLLASPQFGECWGRHWLDVARYAESSGKDINITYPQAWRYRDYVIDSFNRDTPYDQFIQQQIAGDLLPAKDDAERAHNLIATGFLAIGTRSLNEMDPKQFAVDQADEQVSTCSMAILATTMGCARCHDHKFDPISQKDYTSVAGIFLSTDTRYGTAGGIAGRNGSALVQLPKDAGAPILYKPLSKETIDQKKKELADLRDQVQQAIAERRAAGQKGANRKALAKQDGGVAIFQLTMQVSQLESELANYDDSGNPLPLAMGVSDKPPTLVERRVIRGPGGRLRRGSGFEAVGNSPLFARGDVGKPGDAVPRGVPALLASVEGASVAPSASGRLELANWMTSPKNPLISLVIVNRAWHYLFGNGMVRSVDNFGTTGDRPTHPELLDYLASNFVTSGWSIKALVRQIVLSHTYQLSTLDNKPNFAIDPDNKMLWRQNPRRLDAECIRDAMLAASGALDLKPPTGSSIARAGEGPIGGGKLRPISDNDLINQDSNCRSIYLSAARNDDAELLSVFDYPDASAPLGARETTNVPSQALYMMNSEFVAKQSRKLAERIVKAYPGQTMDHFNDRFRLAHELVFSHEADPVGTEQARRILGLYPKDAVAGWTSICRAMFASSTFRYLN